MQSYQIYFYKLILLLRCIFSTLAKNLSILVAIDTTVKNIFFVFMLQKY